MENNSPQMPSTSRDDRSDPSHATQGHASLGPPLCHASLGPPLCHASLGPPLCHAAYQGNLYHVQRLLSEKADIDERSEKNNTALILATHQGHLKVVKHLLAVGASVDLRNIYGESSLIIAVYKGHLNIMQELLRNKADVNQKEVIDGMTPLIMAIKYGDKECVEKIIKYKPDLSQACALDLIAQDYAKEREDVEISRLVLHHSMEQNVAIAKIFKAVDDRNTSTLISLVKKDGWSPNLTRGCITSQKGKARIESGDLEKTETPLHRAVRNRFKNVVNVLIKNHADVHHRDCRGMTAFHQAVYGVDVELADLLVKCDHINIDIDEPVDKHIPDVCFEKVKNNFEYAGYTPLMIAAAQNDEEMFDFLLKNGADVLYTDYTGEPNGKSAKTVVSKNGTGILDMIAKAEADRTDKGKTELKLTPDPKRDAQKEKDKSKHMHNYIEENMIDKVVELLDKDGFNVDTIWYERNQKSNKVDTRNALTTAVELGNLDIVRHLLDRKADFNTVTSNGVTALGIAAQKAHYDILRLLLEAGAHVNQRMLHGKTALTFAMNKRWVNKNTLKSRKKDREYLKCISTLLESGANLDLAHEDGTPIYTLVKSYGYKDIDVVKWRERYGQRQSENVKPVERYFHETNVSDMPQINIAPKAETGSKKNLTFSKECTVDRRTPSSSSLPASSTKDSEYKPTHKSRSSSNAAKIPSGAKGSLEQASLTPPLKISPPSPTEASSPMTGEGSPTPGDLPINSPSPDLPAPRRTYSSEGSHSSTSHTLQEVRKKENNTVSGGGTDTNDNVIRVSGEGTDDNGNVTKRTHSTECLTRGRDTIDHIGANNFEFKHSDIIGEGASGTTVFRGIMKDGIESDLPNKVAIKRILINSRGKKLKEGREIF